MVSHQYKIIIGSDDIEYLRPVASTLRTAGYSIVTTPNSNRLLRMVQKSQPDLVILLNGLKGMDPVETSRALVEKISYNGGILMMAGDSQESTVIRAYEAGVSEYLVHPIPSGLLTAKVKLMIQNPPRLEPGESEDWISPMVVHGELDLPAYRIVDQIGAGAMGEVYQAIHKITFETVAVKVVHSSKVKSIRDIQRFFRGSLIGLELPRHPNLVQILEIKKMTDCIYQVMEFVEGQTLQSIIKDSNLLTEAEAITVLRDICLALDVLHQNQVLHRDVKPGNIFVTRDWICKLGDLGISRRMIDRTATTTGHVVGTPGYISPEQVLDIRPLDIRADIYSLGLTLYHAVTGYNPFSRDTAYDSMLARLQGEEAVLTEENASQLSNESREIINKMIRRKANERFSTPLAVLSELEKKNMFQRKNQIDSDTRTAPGKGSQQDN